MAGLQDVGALAVPALLAALGDRLRAVVLYGSRARGDQHQDSDWDLLVIVDGLPDRPLERYSELKAALPLGTRGSASMLARTPEEFETRVADVYLDIALDGRILYDHDQYMAPKLRELRHTMDAAGLYREHNAWGDAWMWRGPQPRRWSIDWERP